MKYPEVYHIRQKYLDVVLNDIEITLEEKINRSQILENICWGTQVVIAVGSRGIPNYTLVVKKLVELLQSRGACVSIMPAMGSHGGGTADGQIQILEEMGISNKSVGATIVDTINPIYIGETNLGIPLYVDRAITDCDSIILVNRIKSHTEFYGEIESGLLKMLAVGLGRYRGAVEFHKYAVKFGYERTIRDVAHAFIEQFPVLAGIALIDTPDGQTSSIHVVRSCEMEEFEAALLREYKETCLKLPLDNIDILIIDEIGKNISGTGADTKVIGRIMNIYEKELSSPKITRIIIRNLTPETQGNAIGIGLADFTTRRVIEGIDYNVTYINAITAVTPEKARIPIVLPNDYDALDAAYNTIGPKNNDTIRLVWIKNTSSLEELIVSRAALIEINEQKIEFLHGPFKIEFDDDGNLIPFI